MNIQISKHNVLILLLTWLLMNVYAPVLRAADTVVNSNSNLEPTLSNAGQDTIAQATLLTPSPLADREPIGAEQMTAIERLPFVKRDVKVVHFGSIDKQGKNSDWDWWLYREGNEYVLADIDGPGCLYNLLTYCKDNEAEIRFYFDGKSEPAYILKVGELGKDDNLFQPPLAQVGFINCRWSMIPMPFRSACKITSTVQMSRETRGFGHLICHRYLTPEGVKTFTGQEDVSALIDLWKKPGLDPKSLQNNKVAKGEVKLAPVNSAPIFEHRGNGHICSIKLRVTIQQADMQLPANEGGLDALKKSMSKKVLNSVWIQAFWEDNPEPAINCPLGAFFGNELRFENIKLLTHGMSKDGELYCYFPMPFWKAAVVSLMNEGQNEVKLGYEIQYRTGKESIYPVDECGHFTAIYRLPTRSEPGKDFRVGRIKGRGHLVGGQVTAWYANNDNEEEGDVRVLIDGNRTPQVYSDGSESWASYGWGFTVGPKSNPSAAYDGLRIPWSMAKVNTGDWYPFSSSLDFGIEHGANNDNEMIHSGVVFCYFVSKPGTVLTDELDVGNPESEKIHNYVVKGQTGQDELASAYEGDQDDIIVKDQGCAFEGASEFTVQIAKENRGICLRRRFDQSNPGQRALVYVDGQLVKERSWYCAEGNGIHRWRDEEFEIPSAYTTSKSSVRIRIEKANGLGARKDRLELPNGLTPKDEWNEYFYWILTYVN